jgi:heme exporter protein C
VVGIVGAVTLPINHMSVRWWRGIHPDPVIANPEGPTADPEMVTTLLTGLAAFTLVFLAILAFRYGLERALHQDALRAAEGRA